MKQFPHALVRPLMFAVSALALAGCSEGFDWDLRQAENGFTTANAARQATAPRPEPDARGVISYPDYQVAVARPGDTVADVAARLGLNAQALARNNALDPDTALRRGEVLALPRRVESGAPATADGTRQGEIEISTIASSAIDRAESGTTDTAASAPASSDGPSPVRHRVESGETAYSIARLYDVSPRSLAEWNGLDADLTVRAGQMLVIPLPAERADSDPAPAARDTSAPGQGSPTPEPPSAATPVPDSDSSDGPDGGSGAGGDDSATAEAEIPPSPDLGADRAASDDGDGFSMPLSGSIIREFSPGTNEGIDIAADAGTPVRAAADGRVAAITRDTDEVPIMVLRHADELLSVYANIQNIQVERNAQVSRGDVIAEVREGDPAFLHFELRRGFESIDPMPYME